MDYTQMLKDRLAESLDPEMQERYKKRRADAVAAQQTNYQGSEAVDALADGARMRALQSGLTNAANKFGSVGGDGGPKSDIDSTLKQFGDADDDAFKRKQAAYTQGVQAEDDATGAMTALSDRGVKLAGSLDAAERTGVERGREDAKYGRDQSMQADEDSLESDVSRSYQTLAKKYSPGTDFSKMPASRIKALIPSIERAYTIDEQSKAKVESSRQWAQAQAANSADRGAARAQSREDREAARAQAREERETDAARRRAEKLEDEARGAAAKGNKDDEEFNQRYDNINKNLDDLDSIIEAKGTFEVFGDASAMMDKRLYDIALDYAKIVDPASVAREGEVAAAKKFLLPITGLGVKNSTAKKHIEDMRTTLAGRMDAKNANRKNTQGSAGMGGGAGSSPTVHTRGNIPEAD